MNTNILRTTLVVITTGITFQSAIAQSVLWTKKSAPTNKETYAVAFSEDGSNVFSGSECSPSYLRIFSTLSGTLEWDYENGSTLMCIQGVKLSSDGTRAAAIEEMGNLLIFDYTTGTPSLLAQISTGTSGAFALDFSPDGNKIAVGCTDKKLKIYRVTDGALLHTATTIGTWIMSVDWAEDGKYIATGGNDNTAKIWDTTCALVKTLVGHTGAVQSVRFSKNPTLLVSGSKDDKVKLWSVSSGTEIRTLSAHTNDVLTVDISDDGKFIASGGADTTIRIWSLTTGNQLAKFSTPSGGKIYSLDISPDGTKIADGNSSGDVELWDISGTTHVRSDLSTSRLASPYPNPCENILHIVGEQELLTLIVEEATGRTVFQTNTSTGTFDVDLSKYPTGFYSVIQKSTSGTTQISKIFKSK
jgi:WD40 repeat protein